MNKLILHIPHAATAIPIKDGFVVSDEVLQKEILKLTDWHTDDLFHDLESQNIVYKYSRVFCDPERFKDDAKEMMAKVGMGVLYEKTDTGENMRVVSIDLRKKILANYYDKHHELFHRVVEKQLKTYHKALILDCHSFPDKPLQRAVHKIVPRPDFNIGTDAFHTPKKLIDLAEAFFKERNFTLGIDYPFSGSVVPMEYYNKNKNVASIMLEVNRKLYLKEGTNSKSDNYNKTKRVVQEFIQLLKKEL